MSFVESHRPSARVSRIRLAFVATWVAACLLWAAPAVCEPITYDAPEWRKEIAHGCLPYHRLTRADFPIDDEAYPKFAMYTSGFFHYNYKYHCTEEDGHAIARITEWKVRSGFNRNKSSRKSWYKDVEKLLPHEQGHLDINELHSRRLAHTELARLPIGKGTSEDEAAEDLKVRLKALSAKVSTEDQTEQDAYDAQTAHGTDKSRQLATTAEIQRRLKNAGIIDADEPSDDRPDAVPKPKTPLERLGGTLRR